MIEDARGLGGERGRALPGLITPLLSVMHASFFFKGRKRRTSRQKETDLSEGRVACKQSPCPQSVPHGQGGGFAPGVPAHLCHPCWAACWLCGRGGHRRQQWGKDPSPSSVLLHQWANPRRPQREGLCPAQQGSLAQPWVGGRCCCAGHPVANLQVGQPEETLRL